MPAPRTRSRYPAKLLEQAVNDVIQGKVGAKVAASTGIPYETLMRKARQRRAGQDSGSSRRGTKPMLPASCEEDLVAWISGMQQVGQPVDRHEILVKASQILRRISSRSKLSGGWYRRFMQRHPSLTNRVAQVISSARNSVDEDGVKQLFDSMEEAIETYGFTADRIFNMDETSFASRRKSKDVVALKGSRNVWAKTIAANFHLSIVACGNAAGTFIPPLFLLPGSGDMHSISKVNAISIASDAWTSQMSATNLVSGFRTAGLLPLSHEQMKRRYDMFKDGGAPESHIAAEWLVQRVTIREELLVLPVAPKKRARRKRIDVAGRILTLALLLEIDNTKMERAEAAKATKLLRAKRAKKKAKKAICVTSVDGVDLASDSETILSATLTPEPMPGAKTMAAVKTKNGAKAKAGTKTKAGAKTTVAAMMDKPSRPPVVLVEACV
ncbi:hypothetical protein B5M09_002309 [Aphanomyces astaci]|uniref:HTH CENPB-type domain-containing protein n=1 Tax=Aphanomyces astaci TaxID=112090 RepID=A0A3R8DGI8_APHAT|nr:hypothetical protein B5M09_002309 [Aphanomyces astaci]